MTQMRIYIVDDNTDYRLSTSWWLQGLGYKVKDFVCGVSFLEWISENNQSQNECVLMDVRMPNMSGLEVHDKLNACGRRIPVIYMTGHADIPLAVEAMKKGAVTYLEKPLDSEALEHALDSAFVTAKNYAASDDPEVAATVSQSSTGAAAFQRRLATLTPREQEVLDGVVQGQMNKVLAANLGISIKTIEIHRSQIKKKMKVRNTAELITMVVKGEVDDR